MVVVGMVSMVVVGMGMMVVMVLNIVWVGIFLFLGEEWMIVLG